MSDMSTNDSSDSIITEIKAQKYIQHTVGDFTQNNQADLVSVKNDFYRTGKDTYNLTVGGKTEIDYDSRSRTFNGNVEEDAEGNLTEKCLLSDTRLYLGARNSVKIGPSFFTAAFSDTRVDIGTHLALGTIGIGLGVARVSVAIGAAAEISAVRLLKGVVVDDHTLAFNQEMSVVENDYVAVELEDEDDVGAFFDPSVGLMVGGAVLTANAAMAASVIANPAATAAMAAMAAAGAEDLYSRVDFTNTPNCRVHSASLTQLSEEA